MYCLNEIFTGRFYLITEKKSLFFIFLYILTRLFSVNIVRDINLEIYFCKIKSIFDIFNHEI
jgi:hypothetical protein